MILRLSIVAAAFAVAWLLVSIWERRSGSQAESIPPGVTMFTTAECRICPEAVSQLRRAGVEMTLLDAHHRLATTLKVRSVPTLVVADDSGRVTLRRAGRAVVSDINRIVSEVAKVSSTA